jgi:hypothetical protein
MDTFTPGPWNIASDIYDNRIGIGSQSGVVVSAPRVPGALPGVRGIANARLIAAAPDMLAALIEARKQLELYEQHATGEHFNDTQINAAIAKATGESV